MLRPLVYFREAVGAIDVPLEHAVGDVFASNNSHAIWIVLLLIGFGFLNLLELFLHVLSYDLSRHDYLILINKRSTLSRGFGVLGFWGFGFRVRA